MFLDCKKQIMIEEEMKRQLTILAMLLSLEDLMGNKGNYGFIERQPTEEERKEGMKSVVQELRIVDFRVSIFMIKS